VIATFVNDKLDGSVMVSLVPMSGYDLTATDQMYFKDGKFICYIHVANFIASFSIFVRYNHNFQFECRNYGSDQYSSITSTIHTLSTSYHNWPSKMHTANGMCTDVKWL